MFRAAMGRARGRPAGLDLESPASRSLAVILNIGNPQCVCSARCPTRRGSSGWARRSNGIALFGDGTNVEFAHVETPDAPPHPHLGTRRRANPIVGDGSVRGADCGPGVRRRRADADVIAPGGTQRVEWHADGVYLTGWAEVVCEGEWFRQIPRTS